MAAGTLPRVVAADPADGGHAARLRDRRRRERTGTALLLAPAMAWVLLAAVVPLAMIVWVSFWRVDGGSLIRAFDTGTWSAVLGDPTYRRIALDTLEVVLVVLVIVGVVGLFAGYFLARFVRSRRLQTLLLLLAILPFWTSYVIRIITWQPMFGNRGVLNYLLTTFGVVDQPLDALLYNQTAMIFAMASLYVVFVIGPVFWALNRIDAEVLAASRSLGASPWKTFWTVELPLAKGGLVAGLFFASIFLLGDYATERLIGGGTSPALSGTISSLAGSGQWPVASVLSVGLLVIAALVLGGLMRVHDLRREL